MDIGHTIKSITTGMPVMLTGGEPATRAGDERLAFMRPELLAPVPLRIASAAFGPGAGLPTTYSVDGRDISPPLAFGEIPASALSLALVVEDPDAPTPNPFVHWLLYNVPVDVGELREDVGHDKIAHTARGAMQGKNSNLKIGWTGMAPPKGDTAHHYHFQLFALDRRLDLQPGVGRTSLLDAMAGHVVARGEVIGTYQR